MRVRTQVTCGVAMLALAGWCGPAQAWTGEVSSPTFYRAGPGRNYTVLDELDRGETLNVISCNNGWCQVQNGRSTGYAEQKSLVQPSAMPQKPATPGPQGCVESRVTGSGYHKGLYYQFCPRDSRAVAQSGQAAPSPSGSGGAGSD